MYVGLYKCDCSSCDCMST